MTIPAKLKPPSPTRAFASLSLDDTDKDKADVTVPQKTEAVRDDELEAFRRAWRAEVQAKKEVEVDAGGVLWKSRGDEATSDKAVSEVGDKKGKEKGAEDAESWPEPLSPRSPRAPTSPIKTLRSLSPTKGGASAVPHRPRSPVKQPLHAQPNARSPTKATFKSALSPKAALRSFPSASAAPPPAPAAPASEPTSDSDDTMPFPQRKRGGDAIALYTRAVEAEQGGRLSDALHLYRRAFRADDNVDRLYALTLRKAEAERERVAATAAKEEVGEVAPTPTTADIVDPSAPELPEYTFTREVQVHPDYEKGAPAGRVGVSRLTGLLERRVGVPPETDDADAKAQAANGGKDAQRFDPAASFRAADPALPTPIATLPAELLDRILSFLDVIGVERFALTCWRARLLTAQCGLWRRLAERIYSPPMVPEAGVGKVLARKHRDEWRTTLVEEERLRMDGCYISVCHYIRPGAGEQWVTITHMSEYLGGGG